MSDIAKLLTGRSVLSPSEEIESLQSQLSAVQRENQKHEMTIRKLQDCKGLVEKERDQLKAELATLRDGWISVTDESRLPEKDEARTVFVPTEYPSQMTANYSTRFKQWYAVPGNYWLSNVTHHRELPTPPTDGRAE